MRIALTINLTASKTLFNKNWRKSGRTCKVSPPTRKHDRSPPSDHAAYSVPVTGRRSGKKRRSIKHHSRNGKHYFLQSNDKNIKISHGVVHAYTQQSFSSTGASHTTPQSSAHSQSLIKISYTNAQGKLAANRNETSAELAHMSSIAQWDIVCLTESICQGQITTNTLPGLLTICQSPNCNTNVAVDSSV